MPKALLYIESPPPSLSSSSASFFAIAQYPSLFFLSPMDQGSTPSHDDAAMKVQKVYRSYRTRRRLADSAVVAEELWWQAIDFARLNRSTVSFFDRTKRETMASKWGRVTFNASKVGKGLSKEEKAQMLAFQHWIEAIDPRHRYGHNLHLYYREWCKSDAGQPFFYWLDVGDGRKVDLQDCPRSLLRKQIVKYLGPVERERYEYESLEGRIFHKLSGEPLDTAIPDDAKWIFVMSPTKKFYAGQKRKGMFHHSSFLAGGTTSAAGRLCAENGYLKSIWAYSGHYRPTGENLNYFLDFLIAHGVNRDVVQVHSSHDHEDYPQEKIKVPEKNISKTTKVQEPPPKLLTAMKHMHLKKIQVPKKKENFEEVRVGCQRTMSGGLQSPKPNVPQQAILSRMRSKETVRSYQLGHQLSSRWCSGAGPRIGCIADYPSELRKQALEFVNLSPRVSTPSNSISHVTSISSDALAVSTCG